jgi:5'-nucleotidase
LLLATTPAQSAVEDADTTTVQILGINDFHGRILPDAFSGNAGAAVLAGAIDALEAEYPNSVFAAAGDLIGASTFESFIAQDKPTIDALNAMGLDVSAVGNHEFDQGYDDLVNRVMAPFDPVTNPFGGAEWEYLGANVRMVDTGDPALPETWITTMDGVEVGFIGAVTDHLDELVSPAGIAQLEVEEPHIAANRSAEVLEAEGADVIVLLVHEGAPTVQYADAVDPANDFGEIVTSLNDDIDAVISGHTHLAYDHRVPVQGWIDEGRAITERPVVSAGQYGMALNQLLFEVNEEGDVVGLDTTIIDLYEAYEPNSVVQSIVDAAVAEADVLGSTVLGELDGPLYRPQTATSGPGSTRGAESTLGNGVADVQLWATAELGADIAFMNPGGLRADLLGLAGGELSQYPTDVTFAQAAGVQPFANTLVTMTLTGTQLAEVLEEQWQPDGSSRPFLRLGNSDGFTYTYDPAAPSGERILQMRLDGDLIAPADEFTVAVNSFLAAGGDNFSTFAEGADRADSGRIDLSSMVDYLADAGSLGPDFAQRAVGVSGLEELTFTKGDEVAFTVSSLMMTGPGDPTDDQVSVSIGGEPVGTFDVVNELPTDAYDEHGVAEVSFTVPEGVTGQVDLVIEGATTGTVVTLAVTVDNAGGKPDCYRGECGGHADHPGKGKGHGTGRHMFGEWHKNHGWRMDAAHL